VKREQARYLDTFSPDARLFYLAFTFVDGDGIDNGIGRLHFTFSVFLLLLLLCVVKGLVSVD
jgi:hypothetical protein